MLRLFGFAPHTAAVVLMLLGGSCMMAQPTDSARINDLLQQAKERALQANRDAELIESYTRSKTSWVSHSRSLNSMKEHINNMGKTLAELNSYKMEASPWQQEAIRDVDPLLRSMADHLTVMINHLNDNQDKVHMPAYVDYTKANLDLSARMLSMIEDYVDYSESKAKADDLEKKLELPTSGAGGGS
ncbi:MAG: hypothetical protein ACLGXA_22010 [Acidobacteriota bacterium]